MSPGSTPFIAPRGFPPSLRLGFLLIAALLGAPGRPVFSQESAETEASEPKEDEEIQKITLLRLGGTLPADRGEGKAIPLWVVGHYDRDFLQSGSSISAWVKTTRQEVTLEKRLPEAFRLGGEIRGEVLSADDAVFRYDEGEFEKERVFEAHTIGAGIYGEARTPPGLWARLRYRARRYFFDETRDTADSFEIPQENVTHGARLEVGFRKLRTYQNQEIREGVSAILFGEYEWRDSWRSWGDERSTRVEAADARDYWRYGVRAGGHLRFWKHHGLGLDLAARFGEDLDFLSQYTLGSQLSSSRVVGYYYAEFHAHHVVVGNLSYGANLWEGARGTLLLDGAAYRSDEKWKWITGIGLSLRQKVWLGIPVLVAYGYGVDARRDGARGGHEIYLAITAAF